MQNCALGEQQNQPLSIALLLEDSELDSQASVHS